MCAKQSKMRITPVTKQQLQQVLDMPYVVQKKKLFTKNRLNEAASRLGRSPSKLKLELKQLQIKSWPYRKVGSKM